VKNKFRWQWLETTVEITLKGERKPIPLIEWMRKIDAPEDKEIYFKFTKFICINVVLNIQMSSKFNLLFVV
jgi:hypothetical protein